MRKFDVDLTTVLYLAEGDVQVPTAHKLLAPTLLRSQTLSSLHESVRAGDLPASLARQYLARVGRLPIRFLGDAVLRRRAWDIADQLRLASTYDAEYLALTQLQADAFVTMNPKLYRRAKGIVPLASIDQLMTGGHRH
jgi:predicted nucleic acid-binding protein